MNLCHSELPQDAQGKRHHQQGYRFSQTQYNHEVAKTFTGFTHCIAGAGSTLSLEICRKAYSCATEGTDTPDIIALYGKFNHPVHYNKAIDCLSEWCRGKSDEHKCYRLILAVILLPSPYRRHSGDTPSSGRL